MSKGFDTQELGVQIKGLAGELNLNHENKPRHACRVTADEQRAKSRI